VANFETDAEILEWIAKHSEDEFRQNVERHTFGDRRLENARAYLYRIDSERAEIRQERALLATEQAAGVAQDQAETARQALRISKCGSWYSPYFRICGCGRFGRKIVLHIASARFATHRACEKMKLILSLLPFGCWWRNTL
jgi:hypothetical protein